MRCIKKLLKISVLLIVLVLLMGSIHATDDANPPSLISDSDDYWDWDDEFDNEEDDNWDLDDDLDDEFDDEEEDDDYDDLDDEFDDEEDDEFDDEYDYESDYEISDFDDLTFEIEWYLMNYTNNSDMDWADADEFSNEHKIYLSNPDSYTFYKSAEGYETYLKIYDSIISKFSNYDLTENEKNDLKFMIIYYLNHYGNVKGNYTWTRFDEFDYVMTEFDYFYLEIHYYLMDYGNNSNMSWDNTEDFLNERQIYLDNPDNYTFNESAEGYETYLKMYDSIISAFYGYNLTEKEINDLKFMVIYYLNHYGNVNANYLWNRFDEFRYVLTEFDYLILKMQYYLKKYGNNSDLKWIETEDFYSEYQIYLNNPDNYTFNESAEGYETYLKIFDSITSTFCDYNLTENQTEYLKFMIIYYLNHFGNVSANYTWNESDEFRNFVFNLPKRYQFGSMIMDIARVVGGCPFPENISDKISLGTFYPPHEFAFNYISFGNASNSTIVQENIQYDNSQSMDSIGVLVLLLFLIFCILI